MKHLTDAQLEAMFGVTAEEIEKNAKPWESGGVPGRAAGNAHAERALDHPVISVAASRVQSERGDLS